MGDKEQTELRSARPWLSHTNRRTLLRLYESEPFGAVSLRYSGALQRAFLPSGSDFTGSNQRLALSSEEPSAAAQGTIDWSCLSVLYGYPKNVSKPGKKADAGALLSRRYQSQIEGSKPASVCPSCLQRVRMLPSALREARPLNPSSARAWCADCKKKQASRLSG